MSVVLRPSASFWTGTTVKAYPESNWPVHLRTPAPAGEPQGRAAATAKVAGDGTLKFTRLAEGRYYAHAEVNGEDRYVAFTVRKDG